MLDSGLGSIRPNKKMDQYFLKNEDILNHEVGLANLKPDDIVLEIGAGIGNLTEKIAEKCRVIAVEKDERFLPFLGEIDNVKIVNDDAIRFLENNRKEQKYRFNKVVSNIPYSLSQEIVIELLKHKTDVVVLIVQKEFAEKMTGNEKLGLLLGDCAHVEIVRHVSAKYFTPKAVESSMVKIKQKKILDEDFWKFLKSIYTNKNRNAGSIGGCPDDLREKKIHQLCLWEMRELFNLHRYKKGKSL